MFGAETCVRAFTKDEELLRESARAFRLIMLMCPLIGVQMIAAGFFQSIGKASKSIFLSLTRQLLFLIPALLVLPHFLGLDGVWLSMPLSDLVSSVVAIVMLVQQIRKFKEYRKDSPVAV